MAYMPPARGGPAKPGRPLLKLILLVAILMILLPILAYGLFLGAILYDSWMHGGARWN
jgi:hypothetical protein